MSANPPVVHVVDDDESFRRAMGRLLQASGYRVALHESGAALLETIPTTDPGCILLDLQMAGLSGLDIQARLIGVENILPIIFLTGQGDIPKSVQAIKSGAEDFLTKPASKDTLLKAVERALERYSERRNLHDRRVRLRNLVATLTPREREVFALVVRGKLNKQVAFDLGTSERTIKAHRHSIMQKLQVRSLAEVVSIAERIGMLAPGAPEFPLS